MSTSHPAYMPKIIGHRGACGSAPENTLVSIARAAELGAPAVEFDSTVTRDGIAVVMHDFMVDRCTDGTGPVVLKDLNEVQSLDAGGWYGPEFSGAQIPTLHDAVELVVAKDMMLNLELKPSLGWEEPTARATAAVLKAVWPEGKHVLVSSMSELALQVFRKELPSIPLGLIVFAIPENWHQRMKENHCVSLHCYQDFVTSDLVQQVHDMDARIHVYTVNDEAKAKALFAMGVDAIFTDHPERMLSLVD